MTKTYFFWGVTDENDPDPVWKTLHDHFEKLASRDDDATKEAVITNGKAVKRGR